MKLLIFCVIFWLNSADASFVNPYRRYAKYSDGGDPGEPLYLTKYIENGEVELVICLVFFH